MSTFRRLFALSAFAILVVTASGCGTSNTTAPMQATGATEGSTTPSEQEMAEAEVRQEAADKTGAVASTDTYVWPFSRVLFVHASPDAPKVDIFVGWRQVADGLGFPNNTPYRWIVSGNRNVKVNVDNTTTTVIQGQIPFAPGKAYSVFAINSVSNIEPLLLEDNLSRPAIGNAHVRFVHLSPNAPAVDVAVTGGPVLFGDYTFKEASAFTPVAAATYNLEVRLAGTSDVVLPLPGITLEPGKIYTVFARGFVGGSGEQALGAKIIVNSDERRWY